MSNGVYFDWGGWFCSRICRIPCNNMSLAVLATVAHRATLFSLFYWADLIKLMPLRISMNLKEKSGKIKLVFINQRGSKKSASLLFKALPCNVGDSFGTNLLLSQMAIKNMSFGAFSCLQECL